MDPFVGEIRAFGFNFAPRGWAMCNGQTISVSQNTALFSLLGTTYGGNGVTTFGLPDLRGRVAVGPGQAPGLSAYEQGETGGAASVTLLQSEMAAHNHALNARAAASQTADVAGAVLGNGSWVQGTKFGAVQQYATIPLPLTQMNATTLAPAGSGLPHNNLMPYQVQNFCISLTGIFPSRQ